METHDQPLPCHLLQSPSVKANVAATTPRATNGRLAKIIQERSVLTIRSESTPRSGIATRQESQSGGRQSGTPLSESLLTRTPCRVMALDPRQTSTSCRGFRSVLSAGIGIC
jgi:hypothetical protein